ncbi:hypothetical protein Tco_0523223 [Tanacetum coccineum]
MPTYQPLLMKLLCNSCFFDIRLTNLSPRNVFHLRSAFCDYQCFRLVAAEKADSSKPEPFGYHEGPMLMVCTVEVPILRKEDSATFCTGVQKGLVEYSLKGQCLMEQNYQWEKKTC